MNKQLSIPILEVAEQPFDFSPKHITLNLMLIDGTIKRYQSTSSNKIFRRIKANNFLKGVVRVSYGKRKTRWGKIEEFYNESLPLPKEELINIFEAFLGK